MWIVRLALSRPYTFAVMALLIVVLGATSISQMRTDIFPEIDIPVVTVIWTYKGMETSEVERRITTYQRIRHHVERQRHQAHRVADAQRRGGDQDLLPSGRRHRHGPVPGDGRGPGDPGR